MNSEAVVVILIAVSTVICQQHNAQCVDHLRRLDRPLAIRVDLDEPVNYNESISVCNSMNMMLPYFYDLPEYDVSCASQLMPMSEYDRNGCPYFEPPDPNYEEYLLHRSLDEDYLQGFGFNSTSGECHFVNESYLFSCVLCQKDIDRKVLKGWSDIFDDDMTPSWSFVVRLTSIDVRQTTEVDVRALKIGLSDILKPHDKSKLRFMKAFLDESQHLQVKFRMGTAILQSVIKDNTTNIVLNDTFIVIVEDVGRCPSEELVVKDGTVTYWTNVFIDNCENYMNPKTGIIYRRSCIWDYRVFHGIWKPGVTSWELVWRPCWSDFDSYTNEGFYKEFLDPAVIDSRHANVLHNFTTAPVNRTTLESVMYFVDLEVWQNNELKEQTFRDLVVVTEILNMDSYQHVVVMEERAFLIVAKIDPSDPVVGFALNGCVTNYSETESIIVEKAPAPQQRNGTIPVAVDVAPRLMADNARVTFLVLWKFMPNQICSGRMCQYLEVSVLFPLGQVSAWTFMSYGNYYVDITFVPKLYYEDPLAEDISAFACFAWNNDLLDWVSLGCEMLNVNPNGSSTCRCRGKYFVLHDGVPIGKYILKKAHARFRDDYYKNAINDFFMDNIILLIVTAFECLLSLIGLLAIICTAIRFKNWRENKGHKILLHMVMALTCNLILGFIASYMYMKTSSIGCLVYGVLRHYSFLAMFFWMLVLSCLQLKRLTTVVGAKATSHLILKVSLFAWGLPLLPIIVLLGLNPGFYQSDRFDRGYCYPERIVFHVTVQGPAGVILLVNLCIFIKILLHIFEYVGEKKITKHSKGKRAEQLNKLKTSLFIFFLFGFSWGFHILSEERVIASDFLFEYLYLMTATTHILALSLFFIVFQENTRKAWLEVLKPYFKK